MKHLSLASFYDNAEPSSKVLPRHVAIIMDGNGRWARKRSLPRSLGHNQGAKQLSKIIEASIDVGIDYLTLYAFSEENWQRSDEEVAELMKLLRHYLTNELKQFHKHQIRLNVIGRRNCLDPDIQEYIAQAETDTAHYTNLTCNFAISYGSKQELLHAVSCIATEAAQGHLDPAELTMETLESYLYTAHMPDPDLLIRTGGEHRLSNFLLLQSAYTELYFTDTLWPDFSKNAFQAALEDFAKRQRRFGGHG